jgi:hypothetical protein
MWVVSVGSVVLFGGEKNITDFKEFAAALLKIKIAPDRFQQTGEQGGAHHILIFGKRVENANMVTAWVIGTKAQPVIGAPCPEAVSDCLGEARFGHDGGRF